MSNLLISARPDSGSPTVKYRVFSPSTNTVSLPDGTVFPALGLGTWYVGESVRRRHAREGADVRASIEMGYRVIDTAEMYGDGEAEAVVGQALDEAPRSDSVAREQLFVVTKVYPHNANQARMLAVCDRGRARLKLDHAVWRPADLTLSASDLDAIDAQFPPPLRKAPLDMH